MAINTNIPLQTFVLEVLLMEFILIYSSQNSTIYVSQGKKSFYNIMESVHFT